VAVAEILDLLEVLPNYGLLVGDVPHLPVELSPLTIHQLDLPLESAEHLFYFVLFEIRRPGLSDQFSLLLSHPLLGVIDFLEFPLEDVIILLGVCVELILLLFKGLPLNVKGLELEHVILSQLGLLLLYLHSSIGIMDYLCIANWSFSTAIIFLCWASIIRICS
jgi:hypothetical protein